MYLDVLRRGVVAIGVAVVVSGAWAVDGPPVAAWGDSLTAGAGGTPWTTQFEGLSGVSAFNAGVGGETSTQIKNRMLADTEHVDDFAVIWAGRNNYYENDVVIADIGEMVSHLQSQNFLILGVTNGSYGGYEVLGGEGWTFITNLNSRLSDIYGSHFVDVREILISHYDPQSPQDVIDFNNDTVPTSLRYDQGHLNTAGYGIVAQAVYAQYAVSAVPDVAATQQLLLGLSVIGGSVAWVRRRRPINGPARASVPS